MIGHQGLLINETSFHLLLGVSLACFLCALHWFSSLDVSPGWMLHCASVLWEHSLYSHLELLLLQTYAELLFTIALWRLCFLPVLELLFSRLDAFFQDFISSIWKKVTSIFFTETGCRVGIFFFWDLAVWRWLIYLQKIEKFIWIYISRSEILFFFFYKCGGTFWYLVRKPNFIPI